MKERRIADSRAYVLDQPGAGGDYCQVVPHCSGPYSNHFVISQPSCPFSEFLITSPDGDEVRPIFGEMFANEVLPENGVIRLTDQPGWGLTVREDAVAPRRPFAD